MVMHTFDPRTRKQSQIDLYDFETSLLYKGRFRPAKLHSESLSQNNSNQNTIKKINKDK